MLHLSLLGAAAATPFSFQSENLVTLLKRRTSVWLGTAYAHSSWALLQVSFRANCIEYWQLAHAVLFRATV
eukprot:scaffold36006_cov14-Tisochrysis_lutea.AAC.1